MKLANQPHNPMERLQVADPTSQIDGAAVFIRNAEKENMLTERTPSICVVLSAVDEYACVCHSGIVKLALMLSDMDPSDPGIYSVTKKQSWQIC